MDATHIKLPTVPKYVDNVSRKIKSMVKRHAKMLPFTGNYIVENLFYIYLFKKYKMNCFMTQQSSGGVGKIGILIKIKESKDPIMQENIDSDVESLISCILEGEEIIVIPVSIMVDIAGFFGCHSNLLIYRRSFNQLEHFEPHGATFQGKHAEIINREIELYMTLLMEKINEHIDFTNSEMEQKLNIMTKAQLKMILVNSGLNGNGDKKKLADDVRRLMTAPHIDFIKSEQVCPIADGLQIMEIKSILPVDTDLEPSGGYCSAWNMFFAELCLKNPEASSRQLFDAIMEKIGDGSKNDYLKRMIRGYTYFINKKISKYFTNIFEEPMTIENVNSLITTKKDDPRILNFLDVHTKLMIILGFELRKTPKLLIAQERMNDLLIHSSSSSDSSSPSKKTRKKTPP
jgi:hypothetical protein